MCVVDYTGGQAFVVKRALVFVTAIALYLGICVGVIVGISYFLVVFVDCRFHVVHTAVANFDVILVEKAVVFVLFREISLRKVLLTLVLTFLLKEGLYQIIFLCLLRRGRAGCLSLLYAACMSVFPYSRWLSKLSCRLVWPC